MNSVIIALGSNIDPDANIPKASAVLAREFKVTASSSLIRTRPLGFTKQADFLNGVVLIETEMEPDALRGRLKEMETELGRQKQENKWGPREIDLDILIWNGEIVNKDFFERGFLQAAVREILPDIKTRCC